MPPRPYWKGYLKLSLVSCPIAIHAATSSRERVAFRQINRTTGHRLRQQLVDDETHEPVEAADKARGFEIGKGVYMLVEDDELETISIESSHTLEIDSFTPKAQIDERYIDSPYYLVPDDRVGAEAFAVIRDAMKSRDMVGLGRVVLAKRERVMMLQPWGKGLLGATLRYPYEIRDASAYFDDLPDLKIPKDMLTLAEHILDSKKSDFEPEKFVDRYEEALVELLREKQAGLPIHKSEAAPQQANVINLFDALRRSLGQKESPEGRGKKTAAVKSKRSKARMQGQQEMLLPIAGKGQAKEPARKERPHAKPARPGRKTG